MKMPLTALIILVFSFFIFRNDPARAAAPLTKVIMTSGSVSEREGAIYVAQEHGFFRKYGVDVSFVQVRNGPVGMAALSSGETQFHWGSVSGANLGAIAEGADLVFIAGFINRLTGMFVANPKITSPAELKGKYIGVNSLSGGGWIFTHADARPLGSCAGPGQNTIQIPRRSIRHGARLHGRHRRRCGCWIRARQEPTKQRLPRLGRYRKAADSISRIGTAGPP